MSLVPESWAVIAREGETVIVSRLKHYYVTDRLTTWKLVRSIETRDGRRVPDWRITHIFFSEPNEGLDGIPQRLKDYGDRGIRLSDNVIDRRLRAMANAS